MEGVKEISANLMPPVLTDFGLRYALNELCMKISEGETLAVNLDSHGFKERFDKKIEVSLYRITQELLNNIIKHANASQALVQLVQHQHSLMLMIDDNGKGLDQPFEELQTAGFGFRNVESRVKSLDGKMEVDSVKGRGTTFTIEIPL